MKPRRSASREVLARIERIIAIMTRGRWDARAAQSLAAEYGVKLRTIQNYSAEAAKIIWSGSVEEIDVLRSDSIARLTMAATKADAAGEHRAAVAALAERADIAGLKPRGGPAVTVQVQVGGERMAIPAHELVAQMTIVAEVLQRYPEAQAAVIAALRAGSATAVLEAGVVVADAGEGG